MTLADNGIEILFKGLYRTLCLYALHYLEDMDAAEDVVKMLSWHIGTDPGTMPPLHPQELIFSRQ